MTKSRPWAAFCHLSGSSSKGSSVLGRDRKKKIIARIPKPDIAQTTEKITAKDSMLMDGVAFISIPN
jgi:hypothetical protein